MNATQLDASIAQLKEAAKDIQQQVFRLSGMVTNLPCDSDELLAIFYELANADADCSEHFVRFPEEHERGRRHGETSQKCQDDWTQCHNRKQKAIGRLICFARVLKQDELAA